MELDTSRSYRLTNGFLGGDQSLDVLPEVPGELQMSPTEPSSGQSWKFVLLEDGKYTICNGQFGDDFVLDVLNDGTRDFPCLTPSEDASGQAWTVTPWGDGTYRLTSECTGPDRSLSVRCDTHEPHFAPGDEPGTHWTLSPLDEMPADAAEPEVRVENAAGSRRAHKVPNGFFIAWGLVCLAALMGGPWMLLSGLRYRQTHQPAEATVVVTAAPDPRGGKRTMPLAHLQYDVEGKRFDVPAPAEPRAKDRNKHREKYAAGNRLTVWYPNDNPQAADVNGDRGVLLGGIVFTGVGVLFSLVGVLAFIAEFFPSRFIRFG